ncbi:hypothetical protein [Streptomyces sp. NPDC017991]|uniref:hypothetical protein n=1 Tax=Streptomyces sp. NPDC017991 TaxID=3365026 RepID=UPI00378C9568
MTNEIPAVTVEITRYAVSLHGEGGVFASINVEQQRGSGRWAIKMDNDIMDAAHDWSYVPPASERDDEWVEAHLFDHDTALEMAKKEVERQVREA